MRNLTLDGIQSLFAQTTQHVWVYAATFAPPDGLPGEVIRFVNNGANLDYDGVTYTAMPLELTLGTDSEETVPQAKLRVCNVGREIIPAIRLTDTSDHPVVYLEVFRVHNTVVHREIGPTKYHLLSVSVDVGAVDCVLGINVDFLNEPAVCHRLTPNVNPGSFP